MKNYSFSALNWFRGVASGVAIVLCASPSAGQQTDRSRTPIIHHQPSESEKLQPLGTDVGTLRRQVRAAQGTVADRDKQMAKLQKSLDETRRELLELEEVSLQFKAQLNDALESEKEALATGRRHEKALEQAMREAEEMRQAMESLEEECKTQRAFADEAAREAEALRELLSQRAEAMNASAASEPVMETGLLAEAHQLLGEGQIDEAADRFRQGLARWPDDPAYPIGLASCHYSDGKLEVAKALLDKILDRDSELAEAQGLMGLILWQEDDLRQAERRLTRAVRGQPENERWQVYLGMVQFARGRQSAAQEAFEAAIRINPLNPEAQFNMAILLAGDEDPDLVKARVHYEQARRLGSPADAELEKLIYTR